MRPGLHARTLVPTRLQPAARSAYLKIGTATAALRMEPGFTVIGGQRCGTTSIFKALAGHPQILRPAVEKGTDYFSLYYDRGPDWYRANFPVARLAAVRTRKFGPPVAFEACTYYMFHPLALDRIARDYPQMSLVVMLRDPVQRAFSAYKHELARGFETEKSFERALDLEEQRLSGEVERIHEDPSYESHSHRHQAYLQRGQYVDHLERALALFPRERLHVMDSEAFFESPTREFRSLVEFLGLRWYAPERFEQHNARPSSPMPEAIRERLERHYAPYDERLTQLLGRSPHWAEQRESRT